jgi:hypothetical protein
MTGNPSPEPNSTRSREFDLFGGVRRRVLVSIAAPVGWLCFVLLYLAFWAHYFDLFQSIVVIIVSLLILVTIVVGAWVSFGMRFVNRWVH